MKKKGILTIIITLLSLFSYSSYSFSKAIWVDDWWTIQNIYANTYEYYQKKMDKAWNDAILEIWSSIWVSSKYIEDVLKWKLTVCTNFLDKLEWINIKEWADKEDFQSCYNQISKKYKNYMQVNLSNNELNDALSTENILTDSKNWNSPYDLLIDIQDIWSLLFKKEISIEFWDILIWNNDDWWSNNDPEHNWLVPYEDMVDNNKYNQLNNENDENNQLDNEENENKDNNEEDINELTNPNITNTEKNNQLNTNNLQLWNTCLTNENWWDFIDNENIIEDNNQNDWFWNTNNPNDYSWDNQYNDIGFDTFLWDNVNWWDFDLSLEWMFTWWNNQNNDDLAWALWWGSKMCSWKDQLLAICIQMIPSWPNWPVWWTVEKDTLEWIIDQISNTLKDIRQSFIIPAWHGDEALDIDFKHVKFADIFAFNIVLSKKPVFKFEKDEKVEKQKNKADTVECKWVPRLLASTYNKTNIAYCDTKAHDQNKYLVTNLDGVSIENRKPITPAEKVTTNSADWSYKQIDIYKQYNDNLLSFTTNLESLILNWQSASATLKAKSE